MNDIQVHCTYTGTLYIYVRNMNVAITMVKVIRIHALIIVSTYFVISEAITE